MKSIRPLDGVTVVALEHAIAAPFCTRQLADLGARVIKIERVGEGDFARAYDSRVKGLASHFVWVNRSKESVALDLKDEAARQTLEAIVARADVFIQNLAPGATHRLGFGAAELRRRHPRLIVCDISGYGLDGPDRDRKAYDLLIQSEAGFLSVTGTEDDVVKAGCSIADIAAGMYAYTGILAALLERNRTGEGDHIEVSMLEALAEWMSYPLYYAYEGAEPPPRLGAAHATIFPYGPFRAGDGGQVMFGIQNEREWKSFCETTLGHPEWATDERFDANAKRHERREELRHLIESTFAAWSTQEVISRLDLAHIANAKVNDMAGLWAHRQLRARGVWTEVDSPSGAIAAMLPPGRHAAFDYRMDPIPSVGQHTVEVLTELGLDASRIDELVQRGVVGIGATTGAGASHDR